MDLIVFDDTCILCNKFTKYVLDRDSRNRYYFASSVSRIYKTLGLPSSLSEGTIILVKDFKTKPKILLQSSAVLEILSSLTIYLKPLIILLLIPRPIRDYIYKRVSINRHRIWGKTTICSLEHSNRLIK